MTPGTWVRTIPNGLLGRVVDFDAAEEGWCFVAFPGEGSRGCFPLDELVVVGEPDEDPTLENRGLLFGRCRTRDENGKRCVKSAHHDPEDGCRTEPDRKPTPKKPKQKQKRRRA